MRPLLLLDVDGPLNVWAVGTAARPPGFVEHTMRLRGWSRRRPLRMWLNPAHGAALLGLAERVGADLAWATSWDHLANTMVGPHLGLPELPVVEVRPWLEPRPGQAYTWKFGAVARYAAGRHVAWFDDDFGLYPAARDAFLAKRTAAGLSTELISVDPRIGLTEDHLAAAQSWAQARQPG